MEDLKLVFMFRNEIHLERKFVNVVSRSQTLELPCFYNKLSNHYYKILFIVQIRLQGQTTICK